jgi:hypothetical protein
MSAQNVKFDSRESVLVVGTVSNVARTLKKEVMIVLKALSIFNSVDVCLIESDSNDNTVQVLETLKFEIPKFEYISCNKLRNEIPTRIERIRYCRNIYTQYIRKNYQKKKWSYILVVDFDGMNFALSKKSVLSCFNYETKWDGLMANQRFGYYDIQALRSKGWVESDCYIELKKAKDDSVFLKIRGAGFINFVRAFYHFDAFRKKYIYDHMKIIKKNSGLVPIDSGFGGLALYRPWVFLNHDYKSRGGNIIESEHVDFHLVAKKYGAEFFINPSLINNYFNIYNINKFKIIRFAREIKYRLKLR